MIQLTGIKLQNIQTAHTTKYQKFKQRNQKWGKIQIDISSKYTRGQQAHEKMFNISNY